MIKLILPIFLSIGSIVLADTINSITKNPSMAVLGTQRNSGTTIQPWVLPVAVSGAACNSAVDTVAITSDHSSQLVCQSGSWTKPSSGSGVSFTPMSSYNLKETWGYEGTGSFWRPCTDIAACAYEFASFYYGVRYKVNGTFLQESNRNYSAGSVWFAYSTICNLYSEFTCTTANSDVYKLSPLGVEKISSSSGKSSLFLWAP